MGIAIGAMQNRVGASLGVSAGHRIDTVVTMLETNARHAPGYWLQLVLATGIATLGLVLGSTAVVIGGMLVSPLMGPIVELGMGFAVGSSLLVIRAAFRVVLSVFTVIAAAALITMALPFHELTSEIATRTAPTLLDLLVAVFCALAAAYTTIRQTADTTAAAAGTAIGIALVPPLCVTGFGIGTGTASVAGGAALLFTANFSAILFLAVLSFLVVGFNQVDAETLEHRYRDAHVTRGDRVAGRVQDALRQVFGSRLGWSMRLFLPLAFLGVVAVPLKRALDEVSWEVRARDAVRGALAGEGVRAVQSTVDIERHTLAVHLIVIGSPDSAGALEGRLIRRIAPVAGVDPSITVSAVPDANTLAAALAQKRGAVTPVVSRLNLADGSRALGAALHAAWPAEAAGALVGWSVEVSPHGAPRLTLRHLGPALGSAAEQMLARAVSVPLEAAPVIVDAALPAARSDAAGTRDTVWLPRTLAVLAQVRGDDSTIGCITRPAGSARRGRLGSLSREGVEQALSATAAGRAKLLVMTDEGGAWTVRVGRGTCAAAADTARARTGPVTPAPATELRVAR
ncbi:MAG: DUF389 domain-containing protein [Gemmatimonadota bacterium]